MSEYSASLGIELIPTGEQPGTWGVTTNTNFQIFDTAIDGVIDVTVAPGGIPIDTVNYTLTSQGLNKVLRFTGGATGEILISFMRNGVDSDAIKKIYFVVNATWDPADPQQLAPGAKLRFRNAGGAQFLLESGYAAALCCDGSGNVRGQLANLQQSNLRVLGALLVKPNSGKNDSWHGEMKDASVRFECDATITGKITASGGIELPANSNLSVAGSLTVTGASTLNGGLTVNGTTQLNGVTGVAGALTQTGGGAVSLSGRLTLSQFQLNIGGDASYDMYYRGTSGDFTRLPIGSANQILYATATGPVWRNLDVPLNTPASGFQAYSVPYISAAGQLTEGLLYFNPTNKRMGVGTRNPLAALHLYNDEASFPANIACDGPFPSNLSFRWLQSNKARWDFGLHHDSRLISPPAGTLWDNSNFIMFRYNDDNGAASGGPLNFAILRPNGHILMGLVTSDHGGAVNIQSHQVLNPYTLVDGTPTPQGACPPALVIRRSGFGEHLTVWADQSGNIMSWIDHDGRYNFGGQVTGGVVALPKGTAGVVAPLDVNGGYMFFYAAALGTAGGYLCFQYGLGTTRGTVYCTLPTFTDTSVRPASWSYRGGSMAAGLTAAEDLPSYDEAQDLNAEDVLNRILAKPDWVARLREAFQP